MDFRFSHNIGFITCALRWSLVLKCRIMATLITNCFSLQSPWYPSQQSMKEYDFLLCSSRPEGFIGGRDKISRRPEGSIRDKNKIFKLIKFYLQRDNDLECLKRNSREPYFRHYSYRLYSSTRNYLENTCAVLIQKFGNDENLLILYVKARNDKCLRSGSMRSFVKHPQWTNMLKPRPAFL